MVKLSLLGIVCVLHITRVQVEATNRNSVYDLSASRLYKLYAEFLLVSLND